MVQPGIYRIRNVKSHTYLDESNKNPDTVHGWASRPGNDNQKWIIEPAGNGVHIKNVGHGRYLSASGSRDGTPVEASGNPTSWTIADHGRGVAIHLTDHDQVVDLDRGLSEDGASVSLWRFNPNSSQQLWELQSEGGYSGGQQQQPQQQYGGGQQQYGGGGQQRYTGAVQPGNYRVHNVFTGTALDLAGGKSDEGTPVIAWSVGNGQNQVWTFESGNNGYRLRNNASGTYLGYNQLNAGELLAGHGQGPEWQVTQADNGYQLHPAQNTGLVVDLAEGKKEDGAKICLWNNNNQDNQKWKIESA